MLRLIFTYITVLMSTLSGAAYACTKLTDYIVAPAMITTSAEQANMTFNLILRSIETLGPGSVVHLTDGQNGRTLMRLDLGSSFSKSDTPKIKRLKMRRLRVRDQIAAGLKKLAFTDEYLEIPRITQHMIDAIDEANCTSANFVLIGNPLHQNSIDDLDMRNGHLSDGHIVAENSPFYSNSEQHHERLKMASLHMFYPSGIFITEQHRRSVRRFYNLYFNHNLKAGLKTFTDDFGAWTRIENTSLLSFTHTLNEADLEPKKYLDYPDTDNVLGRIVEATPLPITAAMGYPTSIIVTLPVNYDQCKNCDIDLMVLPDGATHAISQYNMHTTKGIFHIEHLNNQYHSERVDLYGVSNIRNVRVAVNFASGDRVGKSANFSVFTQLGGKVYRTEFPIKARKGTKDPKQKDNWTIFNLVDAVTKVQ